MAVSLRMLAVECGVAEGTVSNILASRGAYAADTRQRVMAAARRMGYVPSRLATSLREKRSAAVGVLMSHLNDPYFAELLDAFSRTLARHQLEVMVSVSSWRSPEEVVASYRTFLSWRLQALLVQSGQHNLAPPELPRALAATVVITLNANPWPQCCAVFPDRAMIARRAVEHLVELGHRRIGTIAYWPQLHHNKAAAIRQALQRHGLTLRDEDFIHVPSPDPVAPVEPSETGYAAGRRFAERLDRPTAMIAWSDAGAVSFASGFMSAGGRIPQDLSLVTYNNTRFAAAAGLPLTAVGVETNRFAQAAVDLMCQAQQARQLGQETESFVRHQSLEPDLVVRQSTAAPPPQKISR